MSDLSNTSRVPQDEIELFQMTRLVLAIPLGQAVFVVGATTH